MILLLVLAGSISDTCLLLPPCVCQPTLRGMAGKELKTDRPPEGTRSPSPPPSRPFIEDPFRRPDVYVGIVDHQYRSYLDALRVWSESQSQFHRNFTSHRVASLRTPLSLARLLTEYLPPQPLLYEPGSFQLPPITSADLEQEEGGPPDENQEEAEILWAAAADMWKSVREQQNALSASIRRLIDRLDEKERHGLG